MRLRIIPTLPKFPTLPNLSFLTFYLSVFSFQFSVFSFPIIPIGPNLPKFSPLPKTKVVCNPEITDNFLNFGLRAARLPAGVTDAFLFSRNTLNTHNPKKSHMIEGILGGLVSEVARILEVCKQSRKPAQHQIHQSDGFFT